MSERLSITPAADLSYGRMGDLELFGEPVASGWSHAVLAFTIGITFR